jgi:hypothetical protein
MVFPIALATAYFVVVYFAVAALGPSLALPAGFLAIIISMSAYLFLRATGSDEEGAPMGLLIVMPFICLAAGIAWWIGRLLGLYG